MNFIRSLIEIPVILLVIILAIINDGYVTFSFKSLGLNVTVAVSLLIVVLFLIGYLIGRMDGYVANAPLRAKLRENQKATKILSKEHEKLGKEHEKLNAHFSHLKEDLEQLKEATPATPKISFKTRLANAFRFKKN